ncbi:hypothetical protein D3C71_23070 [compost metagenome]
MFSLIVALIAIALVGLLALAAILYLQNSSGEGISKAQGAQFIQEGGQITGALEIYKVDHVGALPSGTNDEIKNTLLQGNYLATWPDPKWEFKSDYITRADVSEDACLAINTKLGVPLVPSCDDEAYKSRSICCNLPDAGEEPNN